MMPCRECQHEVSKQALTCPNCGAPRPANPVWDGWGYEYKSKASIAGLPLLHISFKYRNYRPVVAHGIIAIGQFATGIITFAQVGVGIVSVSQAALGVWALGQLAVAYSLVAQIGLYVQSGRGQVVRSFAEIIERLFS